MDARHLLTRVTRMPKPFASLPDRSALFGSCVWPVSCIWCGWKNEINQANQSNRLDQSNQTDPIMVF